MNIIKSKLNEKFIWTLHCQNKMRFYGLSKNRLKKILRNPNRIEEGVAPKTVALMQRAGSKKYPTEIWLMYQKHDTKLRLISAWRYPAISPVNQPPPIPEDAWQDLPKFL